MMTPAMLCTDPMAAAIASSRSKVFEAAPRQAAVRRGPPQRQPAQDRSASAVLGETLRRSVQEIEDGGFEVIEATPAK
jgi:hypothetical protein